MSWREISDIMWNNAKRNQPKFGAGFIPSVPKDADSDGFAPKSTKGSCDLLGLTFGIGYLDNEDRPTTRRITIVDVHNITSSQLGFVARCHETRKVKLFDLGRITLVTDWLSGEEFANLDEYFRRTLHADLQSLLSSSFNPFKACRPGLTFLSALAHSDGRLLEEEMDEIAIYCDQVCRGLGLELTDKQVQALHNFVVRFSPEEHSIAEAIEHFKENEEEARLLEKHATRLMDADGVQTSEEVDLVLKFINVGICLSLYSERRMR